MTRLFLRVTNKLRALLQPTAMLDYRQPIRMVINSSFDISRLRACEKEPETVEWIEQTLKNDSVFYDVGANVGAYALIASRIASKVYAFEPSPSTFATLSKNIAINKTGDKIIALQCLLGEEDKMYAFHFSSTESGAAEHSFAQGRTSQSMPMFRLDSLVRIFNLSKPTHVKLDVDGGEMSVLKAFPLESVQSILVETEGTEVQAYLKSKGFLVTKTFPRKKAGAFNYIFSRP